MSGGIALGMFEGSTYESGELHLHPGDALLMYSDGLTEAESPDGVPFDEAGLERTLALYAGAYQQSAAAELGKAIFDAVERHRRDQRLADDLTVLVLSRLGLAFVPPESNCSIGAVGPRSSRELIRPPDNPACNACKTALSCCVLLPTVPAFAGQGPLRPLDPEEISIQNFLEAVQTAISTIDRQRWIDLLSADPPIAIRRSSSSTRWCRRASRASSSRSATARRCSARCPARATAWSSKCSWRPVRADASPRGTSTSAGRAATTSAASPGALSPRIGSPRSRACIACRCSRRSSSPSAIWCCARWTSSCAWRPAMRSSPRRPKA